ncbi:MAG: YjiH family protein [Bacilli bacterium]
MDSTSKKHKASDYLKFIIPSIIGLILFLMPFKYKGESTIPVALFANTLMDALFELLPIVLLVLVSFTTIMTFIYILLKPSFIENNKYLKEKFNVNLFWIIARTIGMIFCFLVFFQAGPEWIWSEDTGGLLLNDLMMPLVPMFLFAGFLLPLLTNFGLLEFVGSLLTPIMRPLFLLPGRSSIDCLASWVGDATIGVALTNKQYEEGYYTTREATVIATNFSASSITFCLIVLSQVGLTHMFGKWYLVVAIAGIIAAIIVPRVPPLSKKPDKYYAGEKKDLGESIPEGYTVFSWGLHLALERAKTSWDFKKYLKSGIFTVLDMWIVVFPVLMSFGTVSLIIAEYTPVFQWLGVPFIPILKLLRIPYAVEASQTMVVGFSDMFIPAIIGSSIPSELTRFVISAVSLVQVVFLSEVGAVILASKIPVSIVELFIIFIERTIVTLPVIAVLAHLLL